MFAACPRGTSPNRINLKAEPATALRLRRQYAGITPGYHMNKDHWNTVRLDGSIPGEVIRQMLEESYRLVAASLPAGQRRALAGD
jgi:predicted DNA-binding protein (MmcQ/YjbR family)